MKKLTRKLFISVLVAVFAFVALGTSTYAWITMSTTAEVQQFEAEVAAGTAGIELSEDGLTNWGAIITLEEDFTGQKLDDLTSQDGITFTNLKAEGSSMTEESVGTEQGYIEFSVWIRQTNLAEGSTATKTIKIDGTKVSFETKAEADDAKFEYTYVGVDDTDPSLTVTKTDSATNLYATNALRMSLTCDGNTVVYQQNDETNGNSLDYDVNGFAHLYAKRQGITLPAKGTTPTTIECGVDAKDFITLEGSTAQEIKIRLWIEGWDNECHSKILSQSFKVKFGFAIQ